jgi:hypothetical protein
MRGGDSAFVVIAQITENLRDLPRVLRPDARRREMAREKEISVFGGEIKRANCRCRFSSRCWIALRAMYVPRDSSSYRAIGSLSAFSHILAGSRNGRHRAGLVRMPPGNGREFTSADTWDNHAW